MRNGIEHIDRTDVAWSYVATIFQVGAGVFLLPAILHYMPQQTVGLWNVFLTVTSLVLLLDFGFRPSFARNVGYILAGVKELQVQGVCRADSESPIDFGLLKSAICAMRKFYRIVSFTVLLILATAGTTYLWTIMRNYTESHTDAYMAWGLLCIANCYELYTYYYDALLLGKGYIKESQQITILSKCIYIGIAVPLVMMRMGLASLVAAQLLSTIIRRILAKKVYYTLDMRQQLERSSENQSQRVFASTMPNAVRVGLTYIGGFLVNKSTILMGSLYLTLSDVATYGITIQVMDVLTRCGLVCSMAYTPLIVKARTQGDMQVIRRMYILCTSALACVMLAGGICWLLGGDYCMSLIGSQTHFIKPKMLVVLLIFQFLEKNHSLAASFIQADNRIPFFIPSLLSGIAVVILLWIFLSLLHWGLWSLILAPGIVQLAYQNWKWPLEVIREIRQGS
ncbi:MAG TPA: hypothetical protein DC006_02320 [Prevotellaceae bacterium]|nr:hypothetical protein [Prevotellaceae bacterium]